MFSSSHLLPMSSFSCPVPACCWDHVAHFCRVLLRRTCQGDTMCGKLFLFTVSMLSTDRVCGIAAGLTSSSEVTTPTPSLPQCPAISGWMSVHETLMNKTRGVICTTGGSDRSLLLQIIIIKKSCHTLTGLMTVTLVPTLKWIPRS